MHDVTIIGGQTITLNLKPSSLGLHKTVKDETDSKVRENVFLYETC